MKTIGTYQVHEFLAALIEIDDELSKAMGDPYATYYVRCDTPCGQSCYDVINAYNTLATALVEEHYEETAMLLAPAVVRIISTYIFG